MDAQHNGQNYAAGDPAGHSPADLVWQVKIERTKGVLAASICGLNGGGPWEYAFYLMRGRERKAVRWYTAQPTTSFDKPDEGGAYHVVGFVRSPTSKDGAFRRSADIRVEGGGYDPTAWNAPLHEHADLAAFLASRSVPDGVHRIGYGNGHTLDFMASGMALDAPGALVCFSGDAAKRSLLTAPIFFGANLCKTLSLPLISVADPLVSMNSSLTLGWYAGGIGWQGLCERIAQTLDHIALVTGHPMVVFGGSGGGFAALNVLRLLARPASAYVWNPQTSITRYHPPAVSAYARCAVPQLYESRDDPSLAQIAEALSVLGIAHDLTAQPLNPAHRIVYLQNESDVFHVERHLQPFLAAHPLMSAGDGLRGSEDGRVGLWVGDWGRGHAPPPGAVTSRLLAGLARGELPRDLLRDTVRTHRTTAARGKP